MKVPTAVLPAAARAGLQRCGRQPAVTYPLAGRAVCSKSEQGEQQQGEQQQSVQQQEQHPDVTERAAGSDMHPHVHKVEEFAAGAMQGLAEAAKEAGEMAADAAAAVTGRQRPPKPKTPTDRYHELRLGGDASGEAHGGQETAYEQWKKPGARTIEEVYPDMPAAAAMQNRAAGDTPRLHDKTRVEMQEQERQQQWAEKQRAGKEEGGEQR